MRTVYLYAAELSETGRAAQHRAGRELLAHALADRGLSYPAVIQTDTNGKPFLPDHPHLHFSISHCQNKVVCALCDAPLGVDLERERPLRAPVASRICSSSESADTPAAFFSLWTAKEAAVKAVGLGLRFPLRAVEIGEIQAGKIQVGETSCFLRRFPQTDGWHLAVCVVGEQDFLLHFIPTIASSDRK